MGSWIRGYLEPDHARRRLLSSATAGAVSICQIPQSDTSVTITARASTTIVKKGARNNLRFRPQPAPLVKYPIALALIAAIITPRIAALISSGSLSMVTHRRPVTRVCASSNAACY
jgi:hypothetical protein